MRNFISFFKNNKSWQDIQVSIIVSTGRTGTKYISKLFEKDKNYLSVHEPHPMGGLQGYDFIKGKTTEDELISFLKKGRRGNLNKLKRSKITNYLESNAGLIFYIPFLKNIFPNLRVAHIIRDPRDFVRSGCSRVSGSFDITEPRYLKEENWLIKSAELDFDEYRDRWYDMEMPERFMWIWNLKNKYAYEASLKHDYIKSFKFENIFNNGKINSSFLKFVSFDQELKWLKNDLSSTNKNKTKKFIFPEYRDWSSILKDKLHEHCYQLMGVFNYSEE